MLIDGYELAWAAGLFEGEGCLTISNDTRTGSKQVRAKLNTTDYDVLVRFGLAVGFGTISEAPQRNPKHKMQWQWTVWTFEEVQMVVAMLWNYLGARRRERATEVLAEYAEYSRARRGAGKPRIVRSNRVQFVYRTGKAA